jgi:hypothetical protein
MDIRMRSNNSSSSSSNIKISGALQGKRGRVVGMGVWEVGRCLGRIVARVSWWCFPGLYHVLV